MTIKRTETGYMIMCGPGNQTPKLCWEQGCNRQSVALCDRTMSDTATCDRPLCVQHRVNRGVNVDYCRDHVPLPLEL